MDSPLRVLHVVVNMNRGGAETLLMNLYRNINRNEVQFDFLTFKEGVFDQEIIEMGGKIHRIPYITDAGHIGFIKGLIKFFKEHQEYIIVHSHLDKMSGIVLKYAKLANIPIRIAHSHNTNSEGNVAVRMYKWYAGKYIQNNATHFYACSKKAFEWLFNFQSKNGTILKNGIDTDKFSFSSIARHNIRRELGINRDSLILGNVGRFATQKNHVYLLEVFAELLERIPQAELMLVGDGPLKEEIQQKIKKLNIENKVKLLGVRADIDQILQAFDLFVMPSFHEGLPVTLIEAQATGLPCFISDQITDEVDMGLGLIQYFPLSDKTAWLDAIEALADKREKEDREQRELQKDFTVETVTENGYDIKKTAIELNLSYIKLGETTL